MNETIARIIATAKQSRIDVQEILREGVLTDKATPLGERWEMFVAMEDAGLLPCESYGDGYVEDLIEGGSLYDDFYVERHETMSYPEMLERAVNETTPSEETIIAWKEKVLACGNGSFTFDW
jgi:hypothetical protein